MELHGLTVLASASWPEAADDAVPAPPPGFIDSSFSALAAEVARRCLDGRAQPDGADVPGATAVVMVSSLGDAASAIRVADAVDRGGRVNPLLFFQSVPNSVAGHIAARWGLRGPITGVGDLRTGLDVAALLIEDADAQEALVIRVEQAVGAGARDRAEALLLTNVSRVAREA